MTEQRLKIAVFIDFDNIEIGVKSTLGGQFDVGVVLDALKERGEVVSKTAYGDWKRAGDHSRFLTQHAIRMVQRNLTPGGDKNGADINLALDALEMVFTHDHINAFVIVGGDSDFISLVEKLKQYDKKVLVVGGRAFTSHILQRNCYEFIAYENLVGSPASRRQADRSRPAVAATLAPLSQAFPLVSRALKVLTDREVTPQLGLLKSTLLQLDSTFSERSYGASTFRDFAEKLAKAGFVNLKHSGRNILVELREATGAVGDELVDGAAPASDERDSGRPPLDGPEPVAERIETTTPTASPPERVAEAVADVKRLLASVTQPLRWPMYVRNVKQALRSVDRSFDERRYGLHSIVELLRACQREGVFRLERDRQGVLRVFQGSALPAALAGGERADQAGVADAPVIPDVEVVEEVPVASGVEVEAGGVTVEEIVVPAAEAPWGESDEGVVLDSDAETPTAEPPSTEGAPRRRRRRAPSTTTRKAPAKPRAARSRTPKPA